MSSGPRHLRVGTEHSGLFDRRDDLYAIRRKGRLSSGAVARIDIDAEHHYAIHAGTPTEAHTDDDVIPVYSAGADGPLAVPTGRVFVRFADGIKAADRSASLQKLGLAIEKTLSYAPSAAWVTTVAGDATATLDHLAALEKLPDVTHVEPQMVMQRSEKD
jgi:hypothetical protein